MHNPELLENLINGDAKNSEMVDQIITELQDWPGEVLTSHKSSSHVLHKLVFLADIGLKKADKGIGAIIEKILANKSKEGLYQVKMNIPEHFGGSGQDQLAWALCDAPLILYALLKFDVDYDPFLREGVEFLFGVAGTNGWPCKCSEELGKFRGPGKKSDSCPYVNLIMLKIAGLLPQYQNSEAAKNAIESILDCWQNSKTIHPYMFYMGTDFRKLKLPFVWYDILNVVYTLSYFDVVKTDERFMEMLAIIKDKKQADGSYIPESIWKSWSAWDFGQKKLPSKYMTYIINDMVKRTEGPKY